MAILTASDPRIIPTTPPHNPLKWKYAGVMTGSCASHAW